MPFQDRASLRLVQASPDPVGFPRDQRVLETELPNGADGADALRDGLSGKLLLALLEVARGEVVRGVLAAARGESLPTGQPFVERHLPGCSQENGLGIPHSSRGSVRNRFSRTRRDRYAPACSEGPRGSASTCRISPSTPRTRIDVPASIGSPLVRPRQSAPLTNTGPSGASRPLASPTSPIRPRWVPTILSRDWIATVSANP